MGEQMKVIFREGLGKCVKYADFSHLSPIYDARTFKKVRRTYRNLLLKELLNYDEVVIDGKNRRLYTPNRELRFSCSYSDYKIAVAVAQEQVGIDIEAYKKISTEHIELFTSDYEIDVVSSHIKQRTRKEVATLIWSYKESLGKLYSVGLSEGFKTFNICKEMDFYISSKLEIKEANVYIHYKFLKDYCITVSCF